MSILHLLCLSVGSLLAYVAGESELGMKEKVICF